MQEIANILKSIPSEAWAAVLVALLTAGLTLIGVWITNKTNNQRLKIQLDHERKIRNEEIKQPNGVQKLGSKNSINSLQRPHTFYP